MNYKLLSLSFRMIMKTYVSSLCTYDLSTSYSKQMMFSKFSSEILEIKDYYHYWINLCLYNMEFIPNPFLDPFSNALLKSTRFCEPAPLSFVLMRCDGWRQRYRCFLITDGASAASLKLLSRFIAFFYCKANTFLGT